jgi:hypothetical protein
VDQVLGLPEKPVHPVGQVPRHLLHPVAVGIHTYPRDLHGTTLEGDDEEDHVADRSPKAEDLDAEEIARVQRVPVGLDELLPRSLLLPLRRWLDASCGQYLRHRRAPDLDREPGPQRIPELGVTPAGVGHGHLDDELAHILGLGGPATSGFGAIVLPRSHLAEPRQNRPRLDQLAALPALVGGEQLGGLGQPAALLGAEGELLAARGGVKLFPEHAPLFLHVVKLPLQPVVDRGGDHHDEKLPRDGQHRRSTCPLKPGFSKLQSHSKSCENRRDDFSDTTGSVIGRSADAFR